MLHTKRTAIIPVAQSNLLEVKKATKMQQTLSTLLNEGKGPGKFKIKVLMDWGGIVVRSFSKKELSRLKAVKK